MQPTLLTLLLLTIPSTLAELDPCLANAVGGIDPDNIPSSCKPCKSDDDIQDAECAWNTRCHHKHPDKGLQTFAIFYRDTSKRNRLKYFRPSVFIFIFIILTAASVPLGTCVAYSDECDFQPRVDELDDDPDSQTFFWLEGSGGDDGQGTDCIRDFKSGDCKCENSDGSSIVGGKPFVDCF